MKASNEQAKVSKLSAVGQKSKIKANADITEKLSRIATSAYYEAQKRGFQPGHELDDWLAAEKEDNL